MKPFREMNKAALGVGGVVLIFGLLAASFNTDKLPVIGGGDTIKADFSEAAGLRPMDEVRIAGVKVGKVTGVDLDPNQADRVKVTMLIKGASFGTQSRADIRIKTVLGRKFVMIEPEGPGQMKGGSTIPMDRTTSPYDVAEAFQQLSTTVGKIDTTQLATAFQTLADTFKDTPSSVQDSLTGLSRLSRTIASRDADLQELLKRSRGVTDILAARDQDLVSLLSDSSLILQEVRKRREVINQLLLSTVDVSEQLRALVQENQTSLDSALTRLRGVVTVLRKNQDNLDNSIKKIAPFVRLFSNNLGNGRWFDTQIINMTDLSTFKPGAFPAGANGSGQ